MLLKLIKKRETHIGFVCELWIINHWTGNRLLAVVMIINEQMPLELIYRLTVTNAGLCVQGRPCRWIWSGERMEVIVTDFLLKVQRTHEEIFIEICRPKPFLPGYPEVDYHPTDFYDVYKPVALDCAQDVMDE